MMESATRKICNAISLGVFLREAPSTIAIILSRKLSPASLVIRTTIQSESTVVPPVTALLSPPASRITGADSPVIALSSTEAAPPYNFTVAGDLLSCFYNDNVTLFQHCGRNGCYTLFFIGRGYLVCLHIFF